METIDLESTRLFVAVVAHGGFSKAAHALRVPKSTVSKAVARLEHGAGTRLLMRTTRSQSLTVAGQNYFARCRGPLQQLEDARKQLDGQDAVLAGHVRITAPEDLGNAIVSPAVAQLCQRHERLTFELENVNRIVDLVREGFDLAVRIGTLATDGLMTRRLGTIAMVAVAAPSYLEAHSLPRHPRDLVRHACINLSMHVGEPMWRLVRGREREHVRLTPRLECGQTTGLLAAARHGAGIALIPDYMCQHDLERGVLERVLPGWRGPEHSVALVSAHSIKQSARLRLVAEAVTAAITGCLGKPQ